MILSRAGLEAISAKVEVPSTNLFLLPEKIIQFGTGVLLRGLPDYFVHRANQKGVFNGRVIAVKSTSQGDVSSFAKQDCLYTVCVRGITNGEYFEDNIINSSISRVLNASEDWQEILNCASSENLQIVISNTTEVGLQLTDDDINLSPPNSYPGKLLAFLYRRYEVFNGDQNKGMVVIPTELIPDNGDLLLSILIDLSRHNGLKETFISWLENSNLFCNSLVDRIVPGRPEKQTLSELEKELGYSDELLLVAEVYTLWAIEGDEKVKEIISFANNEEGIVIADDINQYRELKLRILNGTHTFSCGIAFLCGCHTVIEAMENEHMYKYINDLIYKEIIPSIPYETNASTTEQFAAHVLDRFRNPFLKHQWVNITMQFSSKMKQRCIPLLRKHYEENQAVPELMALGFAAYIYFTRPVKIEGEYYFGSYGGKEYLIKDDRASFFYEAWKNNSAESVVHTVLSDELFWEADLAKFPGFETSVINYLNELMSNGMTETIKYLYSKND